MAVISYQNWVGADFKPLFPPAIFNSKYFFRDYFFDISRKKNREAILRELKKRSKGKDVILLSDYIKQRIAICQFLDCDELNSGGIDNGEN